MMMEEAESCCSRPLDYFPTQSWKQRQKVDVYDEVLSRLRELNEEETGNPDFESELWAHFYRLPARYALDVNVDRALDVIMHKRLLLMAHDPATRPAIEVRLVQVYSACDGNCGESVHSDQQTTDALCSDYASKQSYPPPPAFSSSVDIGCKIHNLHVQDRDNTFSWPTHEITISTIDKPKLLSQLTSLLSEIGLNIQEAHAFSTTDGYSLDVFVVHGWPLEETAQLRDALIKEISKIEHRNTSHVGKQVETGIKFNSNHVNIPTDGFDIWEIDSSLLKFEMKIASGSVGDLFKGIFCGQDVAIKLLRAEHLNENVRREFTQEVYILRKVRHKNIVQFIGACTRPPTLCIITEYMSGGSMHDFLHKKRGAFTLPALLRVAIDVSKGMNYLHQNNIIHRDLKAANLLMDEAGVVKVADFGVARVQVQSGVMTAETGTYRWMAPEVIEHKPYDYRADVFSFGVVLWELFTGKLPYEHLTPLQAAVGVVQKGLRPNIPGDAHPMLVELLEKCWQHDPSLRPEFSEIIEFLQQMSEKIADGREALEE